MSVRAKFYVQDNVHNGSEGENAGNVITLNPVTGISEENKSFFKWTPGGQIQLSTINPQAAEQFVVGKEFYVDFTPADQG